MTLKTIALVLLSALPLAGQTASDVSSSILSHGSSNWNPSIDSNFTDPNGLLGASGQTSGTASHHHVHFADEYPGANGGGQVNACLAAVMAEGGGICDARALALLTATEQINVGRSASPIAVTLLLPSQGAWKFNITDGKSCGVAVHNLASVVSLGVGVSGGFSLQPFDSSTNMSSLLCTDPAPAGGGSYIKVHGFSLNYNNKAGANFSKGLLHISSLYDGSSFSDMVVLDEQVNGIGILVTGMCCGATLVNIVSNTFNAAGATPFEAIDTAHFNSAAASCINCSFDHPGAGKPNVVIDQSASSVSIDGCWDFYNFYAESNGTTDTTTPLVQLEHGCAKFYGGKLLHLLRSASAYAFQISNAPHTYLDVRGVQYKSLHGVEPNCIANLISSVEIPCDEDGNVPDFSLNVPMTQTIGTGSLTTTGTEVSAATCQVQSAVTIHGAKSSDSVSVTLGGPLPATWQTGIQTQAYVTSADTVTMYLCNPTAGALTPAATPITVRVTR